MSEELIMNITSITPLQIDLLLLIMTNRPRHKENDVSCPEMIGVTSFLMDMNWPSGIQVLIAGFELTCICVNHLVSVNKLQDCFLNRFHITLSLHTCHRETPVVSDIQKKSLRDSTGNKPRQPFLHHLRPLVLSHIQLAWPCSHILKWTDFWDGNVWNPLFHISQMLMLTCLILEHWEKTGLDSTETNWNT